MKPERRYWQQTERLESCLPVNSSGFCGRMMEENLISVHHHTSPGGKKKKFQGVRIYLKIRSWQGLPAASSHPVYRCTQAFIKNKQQQQAHQHVSSILWKQGAVSPQPAAECLVYTCSRRQKSESKNTLNHASVYLFCSMDLILKWHISGKFEETINLPCKLEKALISGSSP